MGLVPPAGGFLEGLRELATESGALLVFDEVITGFRVAPGGAQELTGVMPDLTVMGKVIGGGLPAAAYGGPAELMSRIAPAGDVYQAGTLSGNPLAVAAGLAALRRPRRGGLPAAGRHDARARRRAARGRGRPRRAGRRGARAADGLLLRRARVTTTRARPPATPRRTPPGAAALLARGVYPPPSQFEAWFPSLAHTPEHVERTLEAAAAAFAEVE